MTLLGAAVFMKNLTLNEDWMMAGQGSVDWLVFFALEGRGNNDGVAFSMGDPLVSFLSTGFVALLFCGQ